MAEPTSAADNQILKPHSNAIVPHKIANHDTEAVQLNVWNGTEWVNIYDGNDMRNMNIDLHKVSKVVEKHAAEIPAVESAANSAVEQAESAVSASKVNSEAIAAQSEAVSEAKSAISSATAAIQQTAATAASDAAKIRADVAQMQSEIDTNKTANSASVEALKSDISAAKQDLADVHDSLTKAQAAAEESQKTIDNSIAQINSDIEQDRKDIASAQQANADTAKQLDTYSKQAQDQGKTIKSIQDKQDGFTATLADVQGNVTQVSDKVDGLSAGLKDAQDNVASVKAQADQLSATLTDHAKSIATLTASAKELSSTLEDADGRLSKVEQTAQTNSSTLSDVQGDLSQVKQDATTLTATLKDAQGNISTLQQKADSVSSQMASAQGDIASLQTDVTGIKATLVSHEGDIHTLQADSKTLKDDMQDAQGDISTLKKTSTDVTSELKDHAGRISKTEQTASTLVNEFADQQGHLSRVEQKATGTQQTVANQQGQINDIKTDVSGVHETITGQGNQIATINTSLNGLNTKYESVSGDLGKLKDQVTTNSTQITQNKQAIALKADQSTVNNLSGEVSQAQAQLKVQAGQISSKVSSTDFQTLNGSAMQNRGTVDSPDFNSLTQAGFYTITNPSGGKNYPTGSWGTLEVSGQVTDGNGRLNQKYVSDNGGITYTRQYNAGAKSWTSWAKVANQNDIDTLNGEITKNITAIQKNSTAIDQTNQKISLKADQTEVDQIKNTASQNSSRLDVMAGQISSKVTATDVNNIVDGKGYATTSTVQSLITQKAGTINESIVKLDQSVKTGAENNVQLVRKSDFEDDDKGSWSVQGVVATDPPAELGQSGMKVLQTNVRDAYENDVWYSVKPGEKFDVDFWFKPSASYNSNFGLLFVDKNKDNPKWIGVYVNKSNQWKHYTGTITAPINASFAKPWLQMDKDASNTIDTALLAKPSIRRQNATTVAAIQQITASIDGIQSTVANKADKSQITQLSNVIQSKVSTSDFTSKVSQLSNDINLRVTKGDVLSQINVEAGRTLIQSNKIYFDADSFVMSANSKAFIPSAYITNINADKITTGTLDAGMIRVVNLTADNIHGGTLDVGSMNVKNLSANDITTGTLTGINIKAGDNDNNFELKGQNIHWNRKVHYEYSNGTSFDSSNYAVIGQFIDRDFDYGAYAKGDALTIGDRNEIRMGLISSYQDADGSSQLEMQHLPKIVITYDDTFNPYEDRHQTGSLQNKQQICLWTTTKEFFRVGKTMGVEAHLDDTLGSKSTFNIQKDNCVGAYFGQGDGGNQINFALGGDGCGFNVNGPLHVTGSKNSIVETRQGYLAINAYETAEYYFGDIGENNTGDTSQVVIGIDRIFNEVVNTDIQYQVFVTPYSNAHVWVEKRYNNRFIVKSDRPNAEFGWELKAKRKGYESNRLRRVNVDFNQMDLKGEN